MIKKKILLLCAFMVLVATVTSCKDDSNEPVVCFPTEFTVNAEWRGSASFDYLCTWKYLLLADMADYYEYSGMFIINSEEELENYVSCIDGSYPAVIDFSKYTMLLVNDFTPYNISEINTTFWQNGINEYTLNIKVDGGIASVITPWVVAVTVPKINSEAKIKLNVQ